MYVHIEEYTLEWHWLAVAIAVELESTRFHRGEGAFEGLWQFIRLSVLAHFIRSFCAEAVSLLFRFVLFGLQYFTAHNLKL